MCCSTPAGDRSPCFRTCSTRPSPTSVRTRRTTRRGADARRENGIATPTATRKTGKTTSATRSPFQGECTSCRGCAPGTPGLSTRSIAAIARPRRTSSERSRRPARSAEAGAGTTGGLALVVVPAGRVGARSATVTASLCPDGAALARIVPKRSAGPVTPLTVRTRSGGQVNDDQPATRRVRRRDVLQVGVAAVAGGMLSGGAAWAAPRAVRPSPSDGDEAVNSAMPADTSRRLGIGRVVWSVPTTLPLVAVTFDDGPDPRFTPRVLDALEAAGATAILNVMGHNAVTHAPLLRRA